MSTGNLPLYERGKLALKLEAVIRKKAKKNQESGLKQNTVLLNSAKRIDPIDPIHTREELAKVAGV